MKSRIIEMRFILFLFRKGKEVESYHLDRKATVELLNAMWYPWYWYKECIDKWEYEKKKILRVFFFNETKNLRIKTREWWKIKVIEI